MISFRNIMVCNQRLRGRNSVYGSRMNTTSLLTAQHGLVINPFAEQTGVFDFHSPQETALNCSSCATSVSLVCMNTVSVVRVNFTFVFGTFPGFPPSTFTHFEVISSPIENLISSHYLRLRNSFSQYWIVELTAFMKLVLVARMFAQYLPCELFTLFFLFCTEILEFCLRQKDRENDLWFIAVL